MTERSAILVLVVAALAFARADDKPAKAESPGNGVIMLKEAWEANDLDAVVARYVEPGASYIRSDLAALRLIERAQERLGRAVAEKLSAASEEELVPKEKRATAPFVNASLTMLGSRIKGDRATTKFRVATREGERFFRFTHVLKDGDWKIVLAGIDGIPLDEKAFRSMATITQAHEAAARGFDKISAEIEGGVLSGKDAIRKRIVSVITDEREATTAEERGERRDDGHEND